MPWKRARRRSRVGAALLLVVGLSLVLKLFLAWQVREMRCHGDECHYTHLAARILEGHGLEPYKEYVRPPLYPYFLAACSALLGPGRFAPAAIQALASSLGVLLLFAIGERLYDRRAALAAAAVAAFYPNLVAFTHLLYAETLYILWFTLAFFLLVRPRVISPKDAAASGFFLGLAALTRGAGLFFAVLAALWVLLQRSGAARPRAAVAAVLIGSMLLPVLPWTLRNWLQHDRLLLIDTTVGRNLYIGMNAPAPSNYDWGMGERRIAMLRRGGRPHCRETNVVDRERCEVRRALRFAVENPVLTLARVPTKLADLLSPTSFAIRHVRSGFYPTHFGETGVQLVTLLASLPWMGVALLGLAGLLLVEPARCRGLLLLVPIYYLCVHSATFGMSRFRLPLVPFLVLAASPLLTRSWRESVRGQPLGRLAAVAAGMLLLLALWAQRWGGVFDVFVRG